MRARVGRLVARAGALAVGVVALASGGGTRAVADEDAPAGYARRPLPAVASVAGAPSDAAAAGATSPGRTARPGPTFLGLPDDDLLDRLCHQPIVQLEVNHRGTTLKYRALLADGTRASLRPSQVNEAGYFRADVAAYRLSRALGLGMVPPACLRTVTRAELYAATPGAATRARLDREVRFAPDGTVAASLIYWLDRVSSAELDTTIASWRPLLGIGVPLPPPSAAARASAAEGSRLFTWDFLIDNWDRWSPGNTFRAGGRGAPFVWLDNAAGFGHYSAPMKRRNEAQLRGVDRFSRSLVHALRAVGERDLQAALAPAGLSPREVADVVARRARLLQQVDARIARYGEAAALPFD